MDKWKPTVLVREDDPDGLKYHAYAVSHMRVHVREGRYTDPQHAQACSNSLAQIMNTNEVDAYTPHGVQPQTVWSLKHLREEHPVDEAKPWVNGLLRFEDMLPEEQHEFKQRILARADRDRLLREEAAENCGGSPSDYFIVLDRAWAKKHVAGSPACPYGKLECGYCHQTCNQEGCGICEDRAISLSVKIQHP